MLRTKNVPILEEIFGATFQTSGSTSVIYRFLKAVKRWYIQVTASFHKCVMLKALQIN